MAPPSGAAVTRAPLEEASRGGAERSSKRRWGAPAREQGGRVAGAGPHRPCRGGAGYGAPLCGAVTRAPSEEAYRRGRGATPRKTTRRPCQCEGAHKHAAGGADGGRTGRP